MMQSYSGNDDTNMSDTTVYQTVDPTLLRDDALNGGERGQQAFARLWAAYYRRLTVFARAYRGLPFADAEDAVSDALIKAFTGLKGYNPERPLTPWVYRIAANCFSDAAKRARRISPVLVGSKGDSSSFDAGVYGNGDSDAGQVLEPSVPDSQVTGLEERELLRQCRQVINSLEEPDKGIAFLRFFEGLNSAEIGKILKLPGGTVRWKIARIRKQIAAATGEIYDESR
ncbi:MAG: sigma-70 family RNA polymerase sigma factor [Spirochaetaceae bacterium]|jgi:RNA polymerase sigma-70 factor (ECF subfamily)|nr:sigma-70 family RNA polymerase sigma factor [Spirochaetaceae bacterium]